jgi:predicted nucleic acid-binding Zn ribbon protein
MTLLKMASRIGGNRKQQTFRDCGVCGERFGPLSNLKRKFCSKECGYKGRKTGGKKGKKYPHLQRARVGNCEVCNKEFRAVKDFKDRKQKYCSRGCYEIFWKEEVRPGMKNNPGSSGAKNPGGNFRR